MNVPPTGRRAAHRDSGDMAALLTCLAAGAVLAACCGLLVYLLASGYAR